MKRSKIILATAALLCVFFIVAGSASAASPSAGKGPGHAKGINSAVDEDAAAGIREAFQNGDAEPAHEMLKQFREEHAGEFAERGGECHISDVIDHISLIDEDAAAEIREAFQNGDAELAHEMLKQFREDHSGELPRE